MIPRTRVSARYLLVAAALVLLATFAWSSSSARTDLTSKLRWGVLLQTDKAFYSAGETAKVHHAVYNFTPTDVIVFVGTFGGNGCSFLVTLRDSQGQVVWEPIAPMCLAMPSGPVTLAAGGGRLAGVESVPLVYQNNGGVGTPGAPLPPGFYTFDFRALFDGPHRDSSTYGAGMSHAASVPIQILP